MEKNPSRALLLALACPGMGQFYVGRPVAGWIVAVFSLFLFPYAWGAWSAYQDAKGMTAGSLPARPVSWASIRVYFVVMALFLGSGTRGDRIFSGMSGIYLFTLFLGALLGCLRKPPRALWPVLWLSTGALLLAAADIVGRSWKAALEIFLAASQASFMDLEGIVRSDVLSDLVHGVGPFIGAFTLVLSVWLVRRWIPEEDLKETAS
jgi:hypothetical protein